MDEHPNVKLVRDMQSAMESGDMEGAAAGVADDVVWHEIGSAEPVRGKEALRQRMQGADFEITGSTHDVVGNDEHVIALANAHATRNGQTLDYRTAEIYHVRGGKITERWAFSDDTARIIAFFS